MPNSYFGCDGSYSRYHLFVFLVSTPYLRTIIYLLCDRCIEAELEGQPWLGDEAISLSEIATVLETLGHLIVSEGLDDLAGYNGSWYMGAERVIGLVAQEKEES